MLARLAAEVYSIKIELTLVVAAEQRLRGLGYDTVQVRAGDGFYGWEDAAPFDAVIVSMARSLSRSATTPAIRRQKKGRTGVRPWSEAE